MLLLGRRRGKYTVTLENDERWVLWRASGKTYKQLGSEFEQTYKQYLAQAKNRDMVEEGLGCSIKKKRDGSVWIDLLTAWTKLVMQYGTSVYIRTGYGNCETGETSIVKRKYLCGW
jgi:hypothetical protein